MLFLYCQVALYKGELIYIPNSRVRGIGFSNSLAVVSIFAFAYFFLCEWPVHVLCQFFCWIPHALKFLIDFCIGALLCNMNNKYFFPLGFFFSVWFCFNLMGIFKFSVAKSIPFFP